ncbi:C-5 cytosine-specific DNA methylase [Desulfovibrio sp. X2]|uniref:DNA cytosine methyltransferase n=1 Tax=Desulfovibrio sp. X2 TaxID=941449 RepID=UPI0003589F36|nr:DNA cytosine methyltransferase [Desulfovibrio sp. X2]EPR42687.1 C-5 cytosine-specific DNA methylase [Desulfovibrio sp. X2]
MTIRFATVCTGIAAAEQAVIRAGLHWRPVFMSEIEPFPCAVLAHRFPGVPNLGDMTRIDGRKWRGLVDLLVAGTPCQAFSLAGLRRGLEDSRGNLTIKLVELLDAIQSASLLWENVPGVLSDRGNAFGSFVGLLAGADFDAEPGPRPQMGKSSPFWTWDRDARVHVPKWPACGWVAGPARTIAWRCLDAQYFGLAQRRRRVFLVACPRDGADPREILFEREGLRRDHPPRREKGQGFAHDLAPCLGASGRGVERTGETRGQDPVVACFGGNNSSGPVDVATARNAHGGPHGRLDFESETYAVHGGMRVRRLTPRECERLQGMEDDFTLIPWRGRPAEECPDGPRYKGIGNSMPVDVMAWILTRVDAALTAIRMPAGVLAREGVA